MNLSLTPLLFSGLFNPFRLSSTFLSPDSRRDIAQTLQRTPLVLRSTCNMLSRKTRTTLSLRVDKGEQRRSFQHSKRLLSTFLVTQKKKKSCRNKNKFCIITLCFYFLLSFSSFFHENQNIILLIDLRKIKMGMIYTKKPIILGTFFVTFLSDNCRQQNIYLSRIL